MDDIEKVGCPVCESIKLARPFPSIPSFRECCSCGLLYQIQAEDGHEINRVYEDESEDHSARRILEEEVDRSRYYRDLHQRILRHLPEQGRILEIGCGTGGLLQRFQEAGWKCEGVEPSTRLRREASERLGGSVTLHSSHLEEVDSVLKHRPYDAVLGIDVIEHLLDPRIFPRKVYEWLLPGGALFLQTPNARSLRRYLERTRWEQLAPNEHLVLHTRESLTHLLQQEGYVDIEIETTSGSTTDSLTREGVMKTVGAMLKWIGMGNGLWAVARKGQR